MPSFNLWLGAMQEELDTFAQRGVWSLVKKPEKARILGSRWVFTVKKDDQNQIVRYKARLVAQGFRQLKGMDYDLTFSPVINFAIIRYFFCILVCKLKWKHCQIDIKSAYLYAPLTEEIYISQPEGFEIKSKLNYVYKLHKAVYGLHQSGRSWFLEIHEVLEKLNFYKLEWVNCVYTLNDNVVLLLYVDDVIIFGKTDEVVKSIIETLKTQFDLKVMGKTKKLLGVWFEETDNKFFISQTRYIEEIGQKYKKFKFPITSLPIAVGTILSKDQCPNGEDERIKMAKIPYRNLIGTLAFIAGRTRPDISYAINILSQFQSNPGIAHWEALLKLLGYVVCTKDFKLELSNISQINIKCYSDANFASNRDDRVSIGGLILFVDKVPIIWRTVKQKCISLSTMEAEYIALTEAAKEIIWFIRITEECKNLKIFPRYTSDYTLFCDNKAAIDFSNSPIENSRTKHIHIKYLFLRNLVFEKKFKLQYINTKSNLADGFTKPLSKLKMETLRNNMFS